MMGGNAYLRPLSFSFMARLVGRFRTPTTDVKAMRQLPSRYVSAGSPAKKASRRSQISCATLSNTGGGVYQSFILVTSPLIVWD